MKSGTVATRAGSEVRYGLGYEVIGTPIPEYEILAHSGSNTGWKAERAAIPGAMLGVAILTNANAGLARNDIKRLFQATVRARLRP